MTFASKPDSANLIGKKLEWSSELIPDDTIRENLRILELANFEMME